MTGNGEGEGRFTRWRSSLSGDGGLYTWPYLGLHTASISRGGGLIWGDWNSRTPVLWSLSGSHLWTLSLATARCWWCFHRRWHDRWGQEWETWGCRGDVKKEGGVPGLHLSWRTVALWPWGWSLTPASTPHEDSLLWSRSETPDLDQNLLLTSPRSLLDICMEKKNILIEHRLMTVT